MAVKTCIRTSGREKGHLKRTQGILSDEIALRDEILDLKRQVVRLKRTNEQNSVKFRKYEEEAKRKDRQIEQLMDPRKNVEITKILSTKGAAILMNLKDQNNSLIQMILNKDLQIRKLASEIKMSKLYASSKKGEPFRAEVHRLRNLLIRSQEMLRANLDRQESICVGGNPLLEMSSSSDQSSPRDLDDLRSTIQSLEDHVKFSNELLAKKNEQISILTDELNTLRKFFRAKANKKKAKKVFENEFEDFFPAHEYRPESPKAISSRRKITSEQVLELFEKVTNIENARTFPNSAPSSSTKWLPSTESSPKRIWNPHSDKMGKSEWKEKNYDLERSTEGVPALGNPLRNDVEEADVPNEEERELPERAKLEEVHGAREKWKKALAKYKQFKAQDSGNVSSPNQGKTHGEKVMRKNDTSTEVSDLETHEFEMMEKEIQNDHVGWGEIPESPGIKYCNAISGRELNNAKGICRDGDINHNFRPSDSEAEEIAENDSCLRSEVTNQISDEYENAQNEKKSEESASRASQSSENESTRSPGESRTQVMTFEITELDSNDEMQQIKKEIHKMAPTFSQDIQKELLDLYKNISNYQEIEMNREMSLRETYRQSFDSSLESENNYPMQEIQQVQVEVQINSAPNETGPDESRFDDSESARSAELYEEKIKNLEPNDDLNDDDDDVIVG